MTCVLSRESLNQRERERDKESERERERVLAQLTKAVLSTQKCSFIKQHIIEKSNSNIINQMFIKKDLHVLLLVN